MYSHWGLEAILDNRECLLLPTVPALLINIISEPWKEKKIGTIQRSQFAIPLCVSYLCHRAPEPHPQGA